MSGHSHGHGHGHGHGAETRPSAARIVLGVVIACAVLTVVGLIALWPRGASDIGAEQRDLLVDEPIEATVRAVTEADCEYSSPEDPQRCRFVELDLPSGADGSTPGFSVPVDGGAPIDRGDPIFVSRLELPDGQVVYSFFDHQRRTPLLVLGVLFMAAVIALGRWRGLGAIAGLAVSLVVLTSFLLPAILRGSSPVLAAVIAASVIAFVALYLAHGRSVSTSVALLGTFAALLVTVAVSWLFAATAKFSGLTDDSAFYLQALGGSIDVRGIVLAGFVIGALGVLDDVTVTQVSAVWELRLAQPALGRTELYRSALRIGRDHISSTVNTLFLAYAGAALPLLLLFTESGQRIGVVTSQEIVATEIVRSLAGSIGLVSAVPITTWLAVWVLRHPDPAAADSPPDE